MQHINNKKKLLELLAEGATILTPNNRLSAALLQEYFLYCDNKTVDKPICLPYRSALMNAFMRFKLEKPSANHPILLNDSQCQHMWRIIIKSDTNITYSEGLLQAVMQAWEHCEQWQISPTDTRFHYTPQTRQFQNWWQQFNQQLQDIHALSEYQLIPYLMKAQCAVFSKASVWVSFDDFSPQQLSLQQYLLHEGITQYQYDLADNSSTPLLCAAKDNTEELNQLISWLHLRIQQGEQRIGVVVPNLEQESRAIKRLLLQHFDPALFNISLGQPLSAFPIIAHALNWLSIDPNHINANQANLLLQSPYLGNAKEEFINRSHFMQDSTLLQNHSFPLKTLSFELQNYAPKLANLLTTITPYPKTASIHEWIELFQNRLYSLGFPGDYGLNSENYQCYNRFTTLFDELRQLSLISNSLTEHDALDAFTHLAHNTIFQAQKTNASIQISGLLEASGCTFDSLWIMGMTDRCLPQKPHLSAFIPAEMQRTLFMPHSLPARELRFAKQTLNRLEAGGKNLVYSYAHLQGDTPNLPCSLIAHYPKFELLAAKDSSMKTSQLVAFNEEYTVSLTPEEHISGGTAILSNQAKCPFKAFAKFRLRAEPALLMTDGLDSREKGILIHKILELIWQSLGSQEKLLGLNTQALEQQIDEAITTALNPIKQTHPDSFPNLVQEVEHTRLKRVVNSSLDWEKQRPDFTVAAIEQSFSITLSGLEFKIRVDRLDQVAGNKWVIDYKSSLPNAKPWNEERPQEPQLLLYALLDDEINALLLIQLKAGKITCSGLSEEKLNINGISPIKKDANWSQLRSTWRQQLTLLAEEIQAGHCPPQPINASICTQCDFQNLCRYQTN